MMPYFNIFGREINSYAIMTLIGILVSGFYAIKKLEKRNIKDYQTITVLCFVSIGAVIGAHLLYFITNLYLIPKIIKNVDLIIGFKGWFNVLARLFGGWVFYGGLIGGILALLIACKIRKESFLIYSDVFTCMTILFHAFGRIGCFLGGCCFGIESKLGFVYHDSLYELANGVRRFPIQLVESLFLFILFFVLNYFLKKGKMKNELCPLYFIIYSVGRFILEFFRGDTYRGFLWIFSTSQWISIGLFIVGIYLLICNLQNTKKGGNIGA